ncbi:hypothetical protein OBBRIDRAFT_796581 [Obba rivulosa]|uniref:Uncharacterized protein n=1 Tax=Obba rivulosa TaxID=1052685 RepID=A0A8E2ALX1_9APHY|nr:hypothetical protein OBBRIDRAFT_796581 [Obba rivulosa]
MKGGFVYALAVLSLSPSILSAPLAATTVVNLPMLPSMTLGIVLPTEIPNNALPAPVVNALPPDVAAALPTNVASIVASSPLGNLVDKTPSIDALPSNPLTNAAPSRGRTGANHIIPAQLTRLPRSGRLEPRMFREADYGTSPNVTIALDSIPTSTDDADTSAVARRGLATRAHSGSTEQRIQMAEYGTTTDLQSTEPDQTPSSKPNWYELKPPAMDVHNPNAALSSLAGTAGTGRYAAGGATHSILGKVFGTASTADADAAGVEGATGATDPSDAPTVTKRHSLVLDTDPILPQIPDANAKKLPAYKANMGLVNLDSNSPPPEDVPSDVANQAEGVAPEAGAVADTAQEMPTVVPAADAAASSKAALPVSKEDLKYIQD